MRAFIKYPGNKTKLLEAMDPLFPKVIGKYIEPFLGSGSVYFHLAERIREDAYLNDANVDLLNMYIDLRDNPQNIIDQLYRFEELNDEEFYYYVRERYNNNDILLGTERSSSLLYLNRAGFNGNYRVNSKGKYNVPYGHYKNPKIVFEDLLREASLFLNTHKPHLFSLDYKDILKYAVEYDFVYMDPPYDTLDKMAPQQYTKNRFCQTECAEEFKRLSKLGALVCLSNADTPLVRELYSDFDLTSLNVVRTIARSTRGVASELVIRNYL